MEQVTERSLEIAKEAFDAADKKAQGWLPAGEFPNVLKDPRLSPLLPKAVDVRAVLAEVDRQGTGQVSFPDYLMWVSRVVLKAAEPELMYAFEAFDARGAKAADATAVLYMLSSEGAEAERVDKAAAAALFDAAPDKAGHIDYTRVLGKQAVASDTYPIMEAVFSGA
eukprot:TRINITY_DN4426_c0_g4_i1.p1 TRINITY_DN4426_c0_g4~~TRINITY_DN4426_c0_g4_i1.p1  ORF type:complete len:167 (+),score=60.95 TRINITY_DN4426_c0_g4_i1:1921-2421(+)